MDCFKNALRIIWIPLVLVYWTFLCKHMYFEHFGTYVFLKLWSSIRWRQKFEWDLGLKGSGFESHTGGYVDNAGWMDYNYINLYRRTIWQVALYRLQTAKWTVYLFKNRNPAISPNHTLYAYVYIIWFI